MEHKKSTAILSKLRWTYGGEQGIRTLETLLTFTRFPIVLLLVKLLKPLCINGFRAFQPLKNQ